MNKKSKISPILSLLCLGLGLLSQVSYAQIPLTNESTSTYDLIADDETNYLIIGTFTVDETVNLNEYTFQMTEGSTIIVEEGSAFNLWNNSVIQSVDGTQWNGIYASGVGNAINISNSTIRDADKAIHSINGAQVNVLNSILENNNTAIRLENYDGDLQCNITGTTFVGTGEESRGIVVFQVNELTIGSNLSSPNKFHELKRGIEGAFCSPSIYNCKFEVPVNAMGIQIVEFGAEQNHTAKVDNCVINGEKGYQTCGMGFVQMQMNITNTIVDRCNTGIQGDEVEHLSFVNGNLVSNCDYAIVVDNAYANMDRNIGIMNNDLKYNERGIRATNVQSSPDNDYFSLKIDNNKILGLTSIDDYQFGIQVNNCDNSAVRANTMNMEKLPYTTSNSSINYSIKAIQIQDTQNSKVFENTIDKAGTGVWVGGQCLNTQFTCNVFDDFGIGMFILGNTASTSCEISDQGSATNPTDNVWMNYMPHLRVFGDPTSLASPINWYHRGAKANGQIYSPVENALLDDALFINFVENTANDSEVNCNNGIGYDEYSYGYREGKFGKVVRDEIERVVLAEEFSAKANDFVYDYFRNRPDMLVLGESDDVVYQSFYELIDNSNIAEFRNIFDKMDQREISEALEMNAAVFAESLMDENQKVVNQIYLEKYLYGLSFTELEVETLTNIASLTPYLGGDAVYSARVMLDYWPEESGAAYRVDAYIDEQLDEGLSKDKFILYPNPASDYLTIAYDEVKSLDNVSIRISNLMGQLVLEEALSFNGVSVSIDVSALSTGIYQVELLRGGDKLLKDKLVITQ